MASRWPLHLETDEWTLNIGSRQFARLQPFYFLLARHHLARARPGRKARDEFVELRDLLFTLRIIGFDSRPDLRLGQNHIVVPAGIRNYGLVIDVGDVRADAVQKVPVV